MFCRCWRITNCWANHSINKKSLEKFLQVLQSRKEGNLKYAGTTRLSIIDHQTGYHMSCYRKFIAVPKKHRLEEKEKVTTKFKSMARRSLNESSIIASSTGISKSVCIFCNQPWRRSVGKTLDLISAASKKIETSIKNFAQWNNDDSVLPKIICVDFVLKEIRYHGPCRFKYQWQGEFIKGFNKKEKVYWHRERERYVDCFISLVNDINETVITDGQVFLLNDILQIYHSFIRDGDDEFKDATPTVTHLQKN